MTVLTTIATLQAKHAAITGVKSAPTTYPGSINTASLPMVITIPGSGSWGSQAIGLQRQDRNYIVRIYVEPVGQATVDERMDDIIPLLQAFGDAYLSDIGFTGDANIDNLNIPFTDSGVTTLYFGETAYIGFELQVTITEKTT
jgi:hypothetical protein